MRPLLSFQMPENRIETKFGIGATDRLSLRVSVAALVRVLIQDPANGAWMMALERNVLDHAETAPAVRVKTQPFGGAIRIRDQRALHNAIGEFHFDSEDSQSEQDFRLFIQSLTWPTVREFCLQEFKKNDNTVLESDPRRELVEELQEALKINVTANQFTYQSVGTIVESEPAPTANIRSRGVPTVRVYRIFEARILDRSLVLAMLTSSQRYSDAELVTESLRNGKSGRTSAVLTIPLQEIIQHYMATAPEARNHPIDFQNHQLDETVAAILDDVRVPKYQRLNV